MFRHMKKLTNSKGSKDALPIFKQIVSHTLQVAQKLRLTEKQKDRTEASKFLKVQLGQVRLTFYRLFKIFNFVIDFKEARTY